MKNLLRFLLLFLVTRSIPMQLSSSVPSEKRFICAYNCTCITCLKHVETTLRQLYLKEKLRLLQEKNNYLSDPDKMPFEPRRPVESEEEIRRQIRIAEKIRDQLSEIMKEAEKFHKSITNSPLQSNDKKEKSFQTKYSPVVTIPNSSLSEKSESKKSKKQKDKPNILTFAALKKDIIETSTCLTNPERRVVRYDLPEGLQDF